MVESTQWNKVAYLIVTEKQTEKKRQRGVEREKERWRDSGEREEKK
jgi:hypothetical protein